MTNKTAIVVREGSTGDGPVIRVLLIQNANAPDGIDTEALRQEVERLADFGCQTVEFMEPEECKSLFDIQEIFFDMNPPGNDEDEESDDDCESK